MSTIAASNPAAPVRPARPKAQDLDFSTIDTEQKASLVPSLMVLGEAAIAMNAATINAPDGPLLSVNCNLGAYLGKDDEGAVPVKMTYKMPHGATTMQASGTIGTTPVTETWTIDKNLQVHITGQVGSSPEDLIYGYDKASHTMRLDGKVGSIDIHQAGTPSGAPQFHDGTVGHLVSHEVTGWDIEDGAITGEHTTGRLSGAPGDAGWVTQMDTYLISTPSTMAAASKGTIADVPVRYLFQNNFE
ncbi:MAG: hypothetical protein ACYCW6_23985 [Candidatus Xenobia bacterium]